MANVDLMVCLLSLALSHNGLPTIPQALATLTLLSFPRPIFHFRAFMVAIS